MYFWLRKGQIPKQTLKNTASGGELCVCHAPISARGRCRAAAALCPTWPRTCLRRNHVTTYVRTTPRAWTSRSVQSFGGWSVFLPRNLGGVKVNNPQHLQPVRYSPDWLILWWSLKCVHVIGSRLYSQCRSLAVSRVCRAFSNCRWDDVARLCYHS